MSPSVGKVGSAASRPNNFTPHQHHIQQVLAVTSALISVLLALVTFYFFMKVKALLFRHHLIIVLIASDMFKAIWYLVPPVVIFAKDGPTTHDLCQASGFFLALGIEASDFIILLIAIHTALSVLRPGKSMGLHSYRYVAYACWFGCSILLASLAFINDGGAYISQGTFCYLPVRPIWYRLALAWIPRYLILIIIMTIYVSIYAYTKSEFGKFDIHLTSSTTSGRPSHEVPDTPILPDKSSRSRHWWGKPSEQRRSTSAKRLARTTSAELVPVVSQQGPSGWSPDPLHRKQTLLEALRDKSFLPRNGGEPRDTNHNLRKRHKAIKRQLRYMFIYPLAYALMWVPPFINHCYYYTKTHNPPFALSCVALISVSLHCAVDCLIFGIREKPWRYGVERPSRSKRKESTGKNSEHEMAAPMNDIERASVLEYSGVAEVITPRLERNWWDNEPV